MSQVGRHSLKLIVAIAAVCGLIGCSHSPTVRVDKHARLPKAKITKLPKRSPASTEPLIERLIVPTTQPSVGQRVSFETTIVNRDTRAVDVTENYLGNVRTHKLEPGEMMTVTYDYNRLLRTSVIAEYHIRPIGAEMMSKISLSENDHGFGCLSLGTWCKVQPLVGKGQPNFRFSIPLGNQTYIGSNDAE